MLPPYKKVYMSETTKRSPRRRRPRRRRTSGHTQLFAQDPLIKEGFTGDLGDNLYHAHYNTKFLVKLHKQGADPESPQWRSAYRSFEGEVFEVFVYERLLRYVREQGTVKKFIAKIPGTKQPEGMGHTALMLNKKGQIVYRVRYKDLGEFDALIFTDKRLYFVEMTLVNSVNNLRSRLPKKKALLELLFPNYEVHSLLVVNEGTTGQSRLPKYASVWESKGIDTQPIFDWIAGGKKRRPQRFKQVTHPKIVTPSDLDVRTFKYYDTITWIFHSLRGKDGNPMNLHFFRSEKFRRFHDLYTKVYIGTMTGKEFSLLYPDAPKCDPFVYIAIEKDPMNGESFLTYFHFKGRKNLDNIRIKDGHPTVAKKDPMGITVTELSHLSRVVRPSHHFTHKQVETLAKMLEHENSREAKPKKA